jgi:organic radical activating enzyme
MPRGHLSEIFASFQGEGLYAGRRHLFLRFAGCHLRCRYCDTPGSLERTARVRVHRGGQSDLERENPLSVADVLALAAPVLEQGNIDGVAVTGGEPLVQSEFLAELLSDARWPRPRLLETSGTLPRKLEMVLPVVDAVSMDIKLPSNSGEPPFWTEHWEFLRLAGRKAYVKLLVDNATEVTEVAQAAEIVGSVAAVPVFLQPISDASGRARIDAEILDLFFRTARIHVSDVRVLPQTHKMLGIQ